MDKEVTMENMRVYTNALFAGRNKRVKFTHRKGGKTIRGVGEIHKQTPLGN